jgi:1-acyl-sn-glycerol-3-phosphate acyltransferase
VWRHDYDANLERAAARAVADRVRSVGRTDRDRSVGRLGWLHRRGQPLLTRRHRSTAGGAAADYWFDVPVRRFVATSLAGILPVQRSGDGGYAALLAAVRPALKAGRTVVVYPEGTRSTDGSIGEFRSGALRLARDCGVPIVPVAVLGTAEVLPKAGHYSPAPIRVHIGDPVDPASTSAPQLREQVMALRDNRLPEGVDRYALVS